MKKTIRWTLLASLLALMALSGCSKYDPKDKITQSNFKAALKELTVAELAQLTALGGMSYASGRTLIELRDLMPRDYLEHQKKELIEQSATQRKLNRQAFAENHLDSSSLLSQFAHNENEKHVEINEVRAHDEYLQKLQTLKDAPEPLGNGVLPVDAVSCRGLSVMEKLESLRINKDPNYAKELNRRLKRKECHRNGRERKYPLLSVNETEAAGTLYRIRRGYVPKTAFKEFSSAQELAALKAQKDAALQQALDLPPAAFYSALRPLHLISPANPTRVELAEKAIGLLMVENHVSWSEAAKQLVQEQQALSRQEALCHEQNQCQERDRLLKRLAGYVLAPQPQLSAEQVGDKPLPCEIFAISGCKKALPERNQP